MVGCVRPLFIMLGSIRDPGCAAQPPSMSGISVSWTVLALKSSTPAAEKTRLNRIAKENGFMGLGGRIGFGGRTGFGGKGRSLPTVTSRKDGTITRIGSFGKIGSLGNETVLCPMPEAL